MGEHQLLDGLEKLLRRSKCEVASRVDKTIYFSDEQGRQWTLALQMRHEASSAIRCDYCGLLDWTQDRFGSILHKHGCPYREDASCQTHPAGCPL